jgi:hypothetical protein
MQSQHPDRDPSKSNSVTSEPHSGWGDALFVASFVLFIYVFVRTGGFIMPATPTPTFAIPPKAVVQVLWTLTPTPIRIALTPTPTEAIPKFLYQNPDLRGIVIQIYSLNGTITGAYVRGSPGANTRVAQSFVRFNSNTTVYIQGEDGSYRLAGLSDLAQGDTVDIFFAASASDSPLEQPVADEIIIRQN